MVVAKNGIYSVIKDGSSYYRVLKKRTRIGSFLNMSDAINYMNENAEQDK